MLMSYPGFQPNVMVTYCAMSFPHHTISPIGPKTRVGENAQTIGKCPPEAVNWYFLTLSSSIFGPQTNTQAGKGARLSYSSNAAHWYFLTISDKRKLAPLKEWNRMKKVD